MANALRAAGLAFASANLLASPAVAGGTAQEVSIAFEYNAEASAEENYRELRKQARRACRSGGYLVSPVYDRDARRECSHMLLAKTVVASERPALIALHGKPVPRRVAAGTIR